MCAFAWRWRSTQRECKERRNTERANGSAGARSVEESIAGSGNAKRRARQDENCTVLAEKCNFGGHFGSQILQNPILGGPKKTSKKDLSGISYKKLLETNLKKIQTILEYEKFNGLIHCGCLNCFEDYESVNSAFYNLVGKLSETKSETHNLIRVMKNEQKDMLYLKRVCVI